IHPDKHSVPTGRSPMLNDFLQTFRPYGTIPSLYDCATNVPSRWDGFLRSTIVLQTFRPYGTVPPMLNGFSTNIPSLWDGSPGSTIVLQTCRPSGTVSC